jgi:hypothetical protein
MTLSITLKNVKQSIKTLPIATLSIYDNQYKSLKNVELSIKILRVMTLSTTTIIITVKHVKLSMYTAHRLSALRQSVKQYKM